MVFGSFGSVDFRLGAILAEVWFVVDYLVVLYSLWVCGGIFVLVPLSGFHGFNPTSLSLTPPPKHPQRNTHPQKTKKERSHSPKPFNPKPPKTIP